jgi:hypothetical protein
VESVHRGISRRVGGGCRVNPQRHHLRTMEALGVPRALEKLHEDPRVTK